MKKALYSFFTLSLLLAAFNGFSQKRAVYYLQNGSNITLGNIQYAKMTHLVHSFFNPWVPGEGVTHSGDVTTAAGVPNANEAASPWFTTSRLTDQTTAARAANSRIKIIISVGGAPTTNDDYITDRLNYILADAGRRDVFATDLTAFIRNYNLDGFDFDLEHPVSTVEKDNHQTFLALMRTKLDALEATVCKELEISIALNGETDQFVVDPSGADYVNPGVDASVDYYHLMTYDAATTAHNWTNHSPLLHAQEAVRDFANAPFNWPKRKMVIGIPFYGRNPAPLEYRLMGASALKYNDADDIYGGYNYNDCPTIQDKVNYAISEGLAGVLVWEASQDEAHATGYSLTSCLWTAITGNNVPQNLCCSKPNIGPDRITCNTGFDITLDANITGGTFQWTRILPSALTLGTSQTQTITSGNGAGTYVVTRTTTNVGNTCVSADTVVIQSLTTLPAPVLPNRTLCTVPYTLTPTNLSSYPTGTTFQWRKNGVDLAGETSSTLYASSPDNYTLVVAHPVGTCTGNNTTMTLSVSSAAPVDACRTTDGTLTVGVTGGTGPFTWYSGDVPNNTVLTTGTTYTTPSLTVPTTNYYYVEDAGAITNAAVGLITPTPFVGADFSYDALPENAIDFVTKAPVKLKSVDIYLGGYLVVFPVSFNIEIVNAHNSVVYTSAPLNYAAYVATVQTIAINTHLPVGKYRMRTNTLTSNPSLMHKNVGAAPYGFPYSAAQDLTLTKQWGPPQYGPFFNWQIGDYNACPRIPVRAVAAATCSSVFLPIDLDYFEAEKTGNDVLLDWITSAEKNNDYFSIERSVDGSAFTSIGRVEGNGTSLNRISYSYLDVNAPQSVLYYRLAQYDINGDVSYSPIKIIENNAAFLVSIKPNPTASSSLLKVNGVSGNVQLNIFDISGKLVKSESAVAEDEISIGSTLRSGVYVIQIISSTSVVSEVFIKE